MPAMSPFKFDPPIIAHRGDSANAPENTLAAFKKAKDEGFSWIEFDVMLSADKQAVIFHDEALDRTTNGKGLLHQATYSYLKSLDAGSWFDSQFLEERIPSFEEVISLIKTEQLSANIEIKVTKGFEAELAKKALTIIQSTWSVEMPTPLVSSFSIEALRTLREGSNTIHLGLLLDEWSEALSSICQELNCEAVILNEQVLTEARVNTLKASHKYVLSYTVNNPTRAYQLLTWGVDAVFSDDPKRIWYDVKPMLILNGRYI